MLQVRSSQLVSSLTIIPLKPVYVAISATAMAEHSILFSIKADCPVTCLFLGIICVLALFFLLNCYAIVVIPPPTNIKTMGLSAIKKAAPHIMHGGAAVKIY